MIEPIWISVVQVVSTVLLVIITGIYVYLVQRQTNLSAKAAAAAVRSAAAAERSLAILSGDARRSRVQVLLDLRRTMRAHSVAALNWAEKADQGRTGVGRPGSPEVFKMSVLSSLVPHASGVGGAVGVTVLEAVDAAGAANESVAGLIQVQEFMDSDEEEMALEKMSVAFRSARESFENAADECDRALTDVRSSLGDDELDGEPADE